MDFIFQFLDELFLQQNKSEMIEGRDENCDVKANNDEIMDEENFFSIMVFH